MNPTKTVIPVQPAVREAHENVTTLGEEEIRQRTLEARRALGTQLLILGHHYQRDPVIAFADKTGDSYGLSVHAAATRDVRWVVFCGVHFMAETADILTGPEVTVLLPDRKAGCSMADMADIDQVETCWEEYQSVCDATLVPITYMNSTAAIKDFTGRHDGAICTSSNARGILEWAFKRGDKVLFLPDQHLGRNTAHFELGIPREEMIVWDPALERGGNTPEAIRKARVLLWKGHCSVHLNFQASHVDLARRRNPQVQVIVHPECDISVVERADHVGSTEFIIRSIEQAPRGSAWAVGTEHHLVSRLAQRFPDKHITTLSPFACQCATMYRIDPVDLMHTLEGIPRGELRYPVRVEPDIATGARLALDRMLAIPR
jgi:quinolinate synthase